MDPYHIYEFYNFEFTKDDVAVVPSHRLGFLVASGLAANDQILFLNLYVQSTHLPPKDMLLASISAMNSTIFARNLIAKTYEYMSLYDKFNQKVIDTDDKEFRPFAKMASKKMSALRRDPLWSLIKKIRDKLTHHYDLDYIDPIETVKDFSDGHRFQAFIHQRSRTSFYNFAEEIGYLSNIYTTEEDGVTHQQVLDWGLKCSRTLLALHEGYMKKIHAAHFLQRPVRMKRIFVPDHLLWSTKTKIPLLFSEDR